MGKEGLFNYELTKAEENLRYKFIGLVNTFGFNEALFSIGTIYHHGQKELGIQKDLKKAIIWYEKASEEGHLNAKINLASILDQPPFDFDDVLRARKLYVEVFPQVSELAQNGDPVMQYQLGVFYQNGYGRSIKGDKVEWEEAYKWFKLSSDGGFEYARKALKYVETMLSSIRKYKK